jgi:hypothetical protein
MNTSKLNIFSLSVVLGVALSVAGLRGGGLSAQETARPATGSTEAGTTWTSTSGKTIEAEFIRLTDDGVVLKLKADGRQAEVPFANLSLESHLQAIRLGKPEEFSKPLLKANLKPPIDIPPLRDINVDAILVSPFTNSLSLQEFVDIASEEMENGNYFVLWHALPEKMQSDIEDLIVKAMAKVGSGPVVQVRTFLTDLNTVVSEKKEFLFANPTIAADEALVAELQSKWPAIQQFIGSIAKEELWQEKNFQKGNVQRWLASFLAALGSNQDAIYAIAEAEMPGVEQPTFADVFRVVESTADKGQIEISNPAVPLPSDEKLTVRKINGLWLIPKFMNALRSQLDAALASIDNVDAAGIRTGLQSAMAAVIPPVGALARAESQEEFDAVIAQLEPAVRGIINNVTVSAMPALTAGAPGGDESATSSRRGGSGANRANRGGGRRSGGPGIGASGS